MCIYSFKPGHLEYEQNDKKMKWSILKKEGVKKNIISIKVFFLWKSSQVRDRRVRFRKEVVKLKLKP